MKGYIDGYGEVNFDPMDYSVNAYELYAIAICENEQIVDEEHYTDKADFDSALRNTYGREVMDEQFHDGWASVWFDGCWYECSTTCRVAYVVDHDED